MRYLLSLTLPALAMLWVAGCATVPASSRYNLAQTSGGPDCRRLATTPDHEIHPFCGTAAEWEQFDTWAANAGVTCRWEGPRRNSAPELCLSVAQWQSFELNRSRQFANAGAGPGWGGDSSTATVSPSAGSYGPSSYGPFPSGSAVGGIL